ncbi:hypothetical protein AMECASPLE_028094 [Ameca splendens]|uniref:Uncharacterized protein n=1 Tax=Ameca splendens TaxID=208324 RepID=A0ABV1ACU2_9TELE
MSKCGSGSAENMSDQMLVFSEDVVDESLEKAAGLRAADDVCQQFQWILLSSSAHPHTCFCFPEIMEGSRHQHVVLISVAVLIIALTVGCFVRRFSSLHFNKVNVLRSRARSDRQAIMKLEEEPPLQLVDL